MLIFCPQNTCVCITSKVFGWGKSVLFAMACKLVLVRSKVLVLYVIILISILTGLILPFLWVKVK